MIYCNAGINNEFGFIAKINKFMLKDMEFNIQLFIMDLYDNNVGEGDLFYCWKNSVNQKSDIFIRRCGDSLFKRVSIKMGSRNSVHMEKLQSFLDFMSLQGCSKADLDILKRYQYKDYTNYGGGNVRLTAKEYQVLFHDDIELMNDKIRSDMAIKCFANRFLLQGLNSDELVDVIIHGTPEDFLYIKKEDVYNMMSIHKSDCSSAIHFSFLTLQTKDANLSFDPRKEKYRHYIQLKWYNIGDVIIECMNNKVCNN